MALKKISRNQQDIHQISQINRLRSGFPEATSKLSDLQVMELNELVLELENRFKININNFDKHFCIKNDLTFNCLGNEVTLKDQDISIAFDEDNKLGIFVGDTEVNYFIQDYIETYEKNLEFLHPLYQHIDTLQERIAAKLPAKLPEHTEFNYLAIDGHKLNTKSDKSTIAKVRKFLEVVNEGTLIENTSDPDISSVFDELFSYNNDNPHKLSRQEFQLCLASLSELGIKLSLEKSNSGVWSVQNDDFVYREFRIRPSIYFSYVAPDRIAISTEDVNNDNELTDVRDLVYAIIPCKCHSELQDYFLAPANLSIRFSELVPDWVHSGNDEIIAIEQGNTMPWMSSCGMSNFYEFNINNEENRRKQIDEKHVFIKWLNEPDASCFTCGYPYAERKALENCFQSIKQELGWSFENLKIEDLQDLLAKIALTKGLSLDGDSLTVYNQPLSMRRSDVNEVTFFIDDESGESEGIDILTSRKFNYPLAGPVKEKREITIGKVTIDTGLFVDNVFNQSVRYDWDTRARRRKNERIDIMLEKDLPLDEAILISKKFLQQYVPSDEVLQVSKEKTEFDYATDFHNVSYIDDSGTLNELFSRLTENSNLHESIDKIGRITFTCQKDICEVWFHEYSEGYNYFKIFKFKSDKDLFPACKVEIRDKYQCKLDKRERMYAERKKEFRW